MEDSLGPYTVVDAATRRPLRRNKFNNANDAFKWGYRRLGDWEEQDFVVLDRWLKPVARRKNDKI